MASIPYPSGVRDHAFVWALLLSLSIHVLLALRLPNIQFERPALPKILTVELAPPPTPQSVTPEPAPLPPAPVLKPKPSKPKSVPVTKQRAEPVQVEPPHNEVSRPSVEPAPSPPVITAVPKPQSPPVVTAPLPEPVGPSQQDIDAARNLYGNLLAREIAKHKQYPRAAQMRGWQGEAKVELQLDTGGNVLASKIKDSSGHEVLDQQALEMVKKAAPFPTPPEALRDHNFSILVPVSFRLE